MKWVVRADKGSDLKRKRSMETPWARREALISRIHKIDTGIVIGFAGMHNFDYFFSLRLKNGMQVELKSMAKKELRLMLLLMMMRKIFCLT